jgi:O-antigen/teichoic acid export membrane protein
MSNKIDSAIKDTAHHGVVYGIGTAVPRIVSFVLIPVIARNLTASEFGTWALLQSVSILSLSLISCGLDSALMRSYYDYNEKNLRKIVIGTTLILLLIILAVFNFAGNISLAYISFFLFNSPDFSIFIQVIIITTTIQLFNSIPFIVFRAKKKSKLFIAIQSSAAISKLFLMTYLLLVQKAGILGLVYAEMIIAICLFIVLFVLIRKDIVLRFSLREVRKLIKFGLPLVPARFSYAVIKTADRYILSSMGSLSMVGIYSVGIKITQVISFFLTKPIQLIFPAMAFSIDQKQFSTEYYIRTFTYYVYFGFYLCLAISIFSKEILLIIGRPEYYSAINIIPLLSLSFLFSGLQQNLQITLFIKRKTSWLPLVAGFGSILNIFLNLNLIGSMGFFGSAIALFTTRIAMAFAVYIIARRYRIINYEWKRISKIISTFLLLYLTIFIYNDFNIYLSIFLKLCLLAMFPLILSVLHFYKSDEKRVINTIIGRLGNNFHS